MTAHHRTHIRPSAGAATRVSHDLACVVDDARSRPTQVSTRRYDMSLIVPGMLVMRLATAHGRELILVETRLLQADGRSPGLRVTLLSLATH